MKEFDLLLNRVISNIYDTAQDPALWPTLLEDLVNLITLDQPEIMSDHSDPPDVKQAHLLQRLILDHLQRGASLSEKILLSDEKCHFDSLLLQQLPFPMLIISPTAQLVQQNQFAKKFTGLGQSIRVKAGKLCFIQRAQQQQFAQILLQLTQPEHTHRQFTMRLGDKYQNAPSSMNLSLINDQYELKGNILVLIAYHDPEQRHDFTTLAAHFSLTPAEVRLLKKLLSTKTLHQIANEHQVSIHTVRSQLKSVLKKTSCHRQSELIKLMISSPLLPPANHHKSLSAKCFLNSPCFHRQLTLRDGRKLCYADNGAPHGSPIIFLHPSTGSRLQQHPNEHIFFDNNIRIITPDRPGFGLSDTKAGLTLVNYAEDLQQLVDHLQLHRFTLAGYCGGGAYALACTMALSARIDQTLLISPVSPFQEVNLFYGVKSSNRLLSQLALKFPSALQPLLKLMARNLLRQPDRYFDQVYTHLCESDALALSEPELTDNILLALREAMRQGTSAVSHDLYLLSQDWGVDFSQINTAIHIWHGTLDQHVEIAPIRRLQRLLPNAVLHEMQGDGHLLIYFHLAEILKTVKQSS